VLADGPDDTGTRKRGLELSHQSKGRWREPQQGVERRAGLRYWPVIFGDPKIGPLARRAIGCGVPHQRLSALCSPHFSGSGKQGEGHPAPHSNRAAERWLY
jgi:hypothetical protein